MRSDRPGTRAGVVPAAFALATALVAAVAVSGPAAAQTRITIVNTNDPGVGFNDATPASPVGGNPGTTIGDQRLNAFKAAADYWAAQLSSTVEIKVDASFIKMDCGATSAVLGGAGPNLIYSDTDNVPNPNTWYVGALANKLAGKNLDTTGTEVDIFAQFTTAFDDGSCGFPKKWYYGLDAKATSNQIDLVTVVIHELGHGLGFISLVNGEGDGSNTGKKYLGYDDAFSDFLFDDTAGSAWPSMTDVQRKASATNTGHILWTGPQVTAATGGYTAGIGTGGRVMMYAPNPYEIGSSISHWIKSLTPNETLEPVYTGPLHEAPLTKRALLDIGWSAGSGQAYSWILPSSARVPGQGGAFYTTSLKIGNRGANDASFTLKFLGHDGDGTAGTEKTFALAPNKAVTYDDVLASVFGLTQDYGAIRISSTVDSLAILSETSTPDPDRPPGTFGQSVPAFSSSELVGTGAIRSIVGIREDSAFRTNLVLANAASVAVVAQLLLLDKDGNFLGQKTVSLPPLGMTQVGHVATDMGATFGTKDAQLLLSTPTAGGVYAAYAAVIDNTTNDPRTLLPR